MSSPVVHPPGSLMELTNTTSTVYNSIIHLYIENTICMNVY